MCTMWLISVAVVLASMLPGSTTASVCNKTACEASGRTCFQYTCTSNGEMCGEDEFCEKDTSFCVNAICRSVGTCNGKTDGTACTKSGIGGFCHVSCTAHSDCGKNRQCIDGECAEPKCGESFCTAK